MSASPPPTGTTDITEAEVTQESPTANETPDQQGGEQGGDDQADGGAPADGEAPTQAQLDLAGLYETEVKEQDRWLPIANGMFAVLFVYHANASGHHVVRLYRQYSATIVHNYVSGIQKQHLYLLHVVMSSASYMMENGACGVDAYDSPQSPGAYYEHPTDIGNFTLVARIMKIALPDNAKIAKEAKECMQECVSEFISFITSEGMLYYSTVKYYLLIYSIAAEKCQHEKRKTVNGEDILFAMTSLGFENYGEALKIYLARYREV
jgi:nuclear transcription Y subunit beta